MKSEKRAFFRHMFANNFFMVHFFTTFCEILRFLIPILNLKKIFALISTFCKLWLQMRRKRLKKTEYLFLWICLRILLGNHQRVCISKLLKSLYHNGQVDFLAKHTQIRGGREGWGVWACELGVGGRWFPLTEFQLSSCGATTLMHPPSPTTASWAY